MEKDEISEIYKYWINNINKNKKLTPRRSKAIEEALSIVSMEELKLIIRYIFQADDDYALFIRGHNDSNRAYTDLLNLLRTQKLKDKLDKAEAWNDRSKLPEDDFGWRIE